VLGAAKQTDNNKRLDFWVTARWRAFPAPARVRRQDPQTCRADKSIYAAARVPDEPIED